ncbi:unnamed protein product, partial [marine sediment metagenome]
RLNVPVVDSEIKLQASESNKTSLELFFDEVIHDAPGEMILYATLYNKFLEWLDPSEVHDWSKIKFGRELPTKYPKGRNMSEGAQFYIGNISFSDSEIKNHPRLIIRNGKLVSEK